MKKIETACGDDKFACSAQSIVVLDCMGGHGFDRHVPASREGPCKAPSNEKVVPGVPPPQIFEKNEPSSYWYLGK